MVCRLYKCTIVVIASFLFFIANIHGMHSDKYADYGSKFYEDEGRVVFKAKVGGFLLNGTNTGLPAYTSATALGDPAKNIAPAPADVEQLINNGYDIQGSTVLFFHDNIGVEFSLGIQQFRVVDATVANVGLNYANGTEHGTTPYNIYGVPLSAGLQIHVAPFGAIRPYGGFGGYFTYLTTQSSEFKVANTAGLFVQAGIDLVAKDDAIIGIEVKKYFLGSTTVTYVAPLVSERTPISSTVNIDPLIISASIGFKF